MQSAPLQDTTVQLISQKLKTVSSGQGPVDIDLPSERDALGRLYDAFHKILGISPIASRALVADVRGGNQDVELRTSQPGIVLFAWLNGYGGITLRLAKHDD